MKKLLVLSTALLAAAAWAQENKEQKVTVPKGMVYAEGSASTAVKVFTVKAPNLQRIQRTLKMVVGDGNVVSDSASAAIVVRTTASLMPAVEQVVKELDTASPPASNVELTFYILEAAKEPFPQAAPLPAELQPVITQLKSVFSYQGFRLLNTALIRNRSGESADASGQAQLDGGGTAGYNLHLQPVVVSDAHPATIRIDNLHFQEWIAATHVGFSANVDLKEGQRAVIGKTSIEGSNSAFILVASGKIVE